MVDKLEDRVRENKVKSVTKIHQDEHCDTGDARRVVLVDCAGDQINALNPLPVSITGITIPPLSVNLTHLDNYPNSGDVHDSVRVGDGTNLLEITACKDARVVDTLHCGGINKIITVTNTPVKIAVTTGTPKSNRKTIFVQPLKKGLHWGFQADITADEASTGGAPLGKNQPMEIDAEANTDVYLVGPAAGVKVFIGEA